VVLITLLRINVYFGEVYFAYYFAANKVYFGEDLEETSFKFIELRCMFHERNLPPASKRPRIQAINHRLGIWDLQCNRMKMLNDVVKNPYNSDFIVYGYKDPEYPENIDQSFKIIVE
jgi:hypothetical protein